MNEAQKLPKPQLLSLDLLEENVGQVEGLPANPRTISEEKYELLKKDIQNYPEFLRYNSLKVLPLSNGKYVVIGGNMRFKALQELGFSEVPCLIYPPHSELTRLKAYMVMDNSSFGQWNWQMLQSDEWNIDELSDWGIDMPIMESEIDIDNFFNSLDNEEQKPKSEHITIVLPDSLKNLKNDIIEDIKKGLSKYNGISIR